MSRRPKPQPQGENPVRRIIGVPRFEVEQHGGTFRPLAEVVSGSYTPKHPKMEHPECWDTSDIKFKHF